MNILLLVAVRARNRVDVGVELLSLHSSPFSSSLLEFLALRGGYTAWRSQGRRLMEKMLLVRLYQTT
jgi:hypothetical protein